MVGTNGEDDMSSNARSVESGLLHGEGDLFVRFLLTRGWSWRGDEEKLSVDVDQAELRGLVGLLG